MTIVYKVCMVPYVCSTVSQAQKTESAKGQKLAFAKVDKEKKEKKMPVLVKKPRTESEKVQELNETETAEKREDSEHAKIPEAKPETATDGGIGLAYSDSESES